MTNGRVCSIISKLSVRRHEASKRMEKSRSWPSAHDWKSCIPQKGIEGSNPSFSAKKNPILADGVFFLAEIRRRDLNNQMQVSGGHLRMPHSRHSHLSVPNPSFSARQGRKWNSPGMPSRQFNDFQFAEEMNVLRGIRHSVIRLEESLWLKFERLPAETKKI